MLDFVNALFERIYTGIPHKRGSKQGFTLEFLLNRSLAKLFHQTKYTFEITLDNKLYYLTNDENEGAGLSFTLLNENYVPVTKDASQDYDVFIEEHFSAFTKVNKVTHMNDLCFIYELITHRDKQSLVYIKTIENSLKTFCNKYPLVKKAVDLIEKYPHEHRFNWLGVMKESASNVTYPGAFFKFTDAKEYIKNNYPDNLNLFYKFDDNFYIKEPKEWTFVGTVFYILGLLLRGASLEDFYEVLLHYNEPLIREISLRLNSDLKLISGKLNHDH